MKIYSYTDDYFEQVKQDAIGEVQSLEYNKEMMKCSKKMFNTLLSEWLDDLSCADNEEDIAYHNEFYNRQIYKKKYLSY